MSIFKCVYSGDSPVEVGMSIEGHAYKSNRGMRIKLTKTTDNICNVNGVPQWVKGADLPLDGNLWKWEKVMEECVCKYCGYKKDEVWMKRISTTILGKPYNICYSCAENFDRSGKWDEKVNDILWSAFQETHD